MTDVTGFGLVGHLHEMLRASSVAAELELDAVPLLEGAEEVASRGILSSLQPDNLRLRRIVHEASRFAADPRFALLFDPQTAGGLLAGLPASAAAAALTELREAGYARAAVIGRVVEGDPTIRLG